MSRTAPDGIVRAPRRHDRFIRVRGRRGQTHSEFRPAFAFRQSLDLADRVAGVGQNAIEQIANIRHAGAVAACVDAALCLGCSLIDGTMVDLVHQRTQQRVACQDKPGDRERLHRQPGAGEGADGGGKPQGRPPGTQARGTAVTCSTRALAKLSRSVIAGGTNPAVLNARVALFRPGRAILTSV